MTTIKKRNNGLWITAGIAAIALAYAYYVFLPGQRRIQARESDLNEQQHFIVQSTRLTSSIRHAEQSLERAAERITRWEERTPPTTKLARIYAKISRGAQEAETTLLRFEPQKPVIMETIQMMPVQVACRADVHELFNFLNRLERMNTTVWVDKLTITPVEGHGEDLSCEFTLTIFTRTSDFSG